MATQVETLLPGNPLAKAEEHGKVIRGEPEEQEGSRGDGAKRQTGVADQGSSSGGSSPGQGGTPGTEERTSKEATDGSKGGSDGEDKPNEEGVKGCNRKEFTEAPPPKVNPWTRKMNAVTVVSVNGQAHHGSYPPLHVDFYWLSSVVLVSVRPGVLAQVDRAAVTGFTYHVLNRMEEINKLHVCAEAVVAFLLLPFASLVIFGVKPPLLLLLLFILLVEAILGFRVADCRGITPLKKKKKKSLKYAPVAFLKRTFLSSHLSSGQI